MNKEEQAKQFLSDCRAKMTITFDYRNVYAHNKTMVDYYHVVTMRQSPKGFRQYSCIRQTTDGKPPTEYEVLKSFPKEPPSTDKYRFARLNGYEINNESDEETVVALHNTAKREWRGCLRLFEDVWEQFEKISQ